MHVGGVLVAAAVAQYQPIALAALQQQRLDIGP